MHLQKSLLKLAVSISIPFLQLTFPSLTLAQSDQPARILFINQVRGEECCDIGSLDHLKMQIKTFQNTKLPATFVIRYDALTDPQFQSVLKTLDKKQFELGLFLEITPQLAQDSGVEYHGTPQTWYQAQFSYTPGYSLQDRQKIIDHLFTTFKDIFNEYPKTTTGWFIDTDTINYMHDTYQTQVHQLTKEQWETDSYTLSGGPFHYPYLASRNWAFLPNPDKSTQPPENATLIVRQTVADPLYTFGDHDSAFTSQPNDYVRDGKDFSYFQKLIDQTLQQNQNPYRFAVLGLENSMDTTYQEEFAHQIQYIVDSSEKMPEMSVLKASDFYQEFLEKWSSQRVSAIRGTDLVHNLPISAIWINTPNYRLRLLKKDQQIMITDLRIYNAKLTDPYHHFVARANGFWISPFLIDASRFYKLPQDTADTQTFKQKIIQSLQKKFLPAPPEKVDLDLPVTHDFAEGLSSVALQLPEMEGDRWTLQPTEAGNGQQLGYTTAGGKPVILQFLENQFTITTENAADSFDLNSLASLPALPFLKVEKQNKSRQIIQWLLPDKKTVAYALTADCPDTETCFFSPQIGQTLDWPNFLQIHYPFLFPENIPRQIDAQQSLVYTPKTYALIGHEPIKFFIQPKDHFGYPITVNNAPTITSVPEIKDYSIDFPQEKNAQTIITIAENRVGKYDIEMKYDTLIHKQSIYFAPDCSTDFFYCLKHPIEMSWYIKSIFISMIKNSQ